MNKQTVQLDHAMISLKDVWGIFKRNKGKILFWTLLLACLTSFFSLTRPIQYSGEATFRDKGTKQSDVGSSPILQALGGLPATTVNSEAISLMSSRRLLAPVIEKLGFQASVSPKKMQWNTLAKIADNLSIEYAYFQNRKAPLATHSLPTVLAQNVHYIGEIPLNLELTFLSENLFEVRDANQELLGEGKLGEAISLPNQIQFTLYLNPNTAEINIDEGTRFNLGLQPLQTTFRQLAAASKVEANKKDKGIVNLTFTGIDRIVTSQFINELMAEYHRYLKEESDRLSKQQMRYLSQRENETSKRVELLLEDHADSLSSGFSSTGFPDSEKEMEFLGRSQLEYKQRLFNIELESRRLQNFQDEDYAYYAPSVDGETINSILNTIRSLKQKRDFLALAIRNHQKPDSATQNQLFADNLTDLNQIQNTTKELKVLLKSVENNAKVLPKLKISEDPRLLINIWMAEWNKDCVSCKDHFITYLQNQIFLFDVFEKIIQDRLLHQQNPQEEFQGISLPTAEEIYREFSKQISDVQSTMKQHDFLLDQMKDQSFEITSLSSAIKDPISLEMISKSTALAIAVKDTNNRSEREIARLGDELAIQRQFLTLHLDQINQLNRLQEQLLQEKLRAIQGVTIELTNQQISILENHLADYTKIRNENLQQERKLIEEQVAGLRKELAKLPKKWISEQILKQRMELNKRVMDEVTRLVETKNIAHNMELIQSAPIDESIAPILPKSPRLFLFAFLGALLGLCGSCAVFTLQAISKGIPASAANLKLAGQQVAGTLSMRCPPANRESLSDGDLSTLRRLASQLFQPQAVCMNALGDNLVIIQGKGPDYSSCLAALMGKQRNKVILLDLSFDRSADLAHMPGLLDYLEERAAYPYIQKGSEYDQISTGGISRYSSELIHSARFSELLTKLRIEYDQVIAVCRVLATSAEAEGLLKVFDSLAVTIAGETLQELSPYLNYSEEKKVSFIIL